MENYFSRIEIQNKVLISNKLIDIAQAGTESFYDEFGTDKVIITVEATLLANCKLLFSWL